MEIGRRLRALRVDRGLALPAAAQLVGLRPMTLGSYERGERALSAAGLVDIADGYGVEPCHLLPGGHTVDPVTALAVIRDLVEQSAGVGA